MNVRAKFRCESLTSPHEGQIDVYLQPVYSENPNHENKAFWDSTPAGSIQMSINNLRAAKAFEVGKEYYVDFSPAPETTDAD